MVEVIDMQKMMYINLFEKVTKLRIRYCFLYNEILMFVVPKKLLSKAIGEGAQNIKKLSEILKKRIRIVPMPEGIEEMEIFIRKIVDPVEFKSVEVQGDEMILTAGSRNKAALLGRNKRRLLEMQKIISIFFRKNFKIV